MTEKKKEHPQAKWLRAIADGETLQFQDVVGAWHHADISVVLADIASEVNTILRIKPRTITIGKYEVAEPMREVPSVGTRYFYVDFWQETSLCDLHWDSDEHDLTVFKSGMCWLKREDAALAAKAIREMLTGKQK